MPKTVDEQLEEQVKKDLLKESKDNKVSYLAAFPNLVDLVENDDNVLEFMVFDPSAKKCTSTTVIEIDGRTYKTPIKKLLPTNMVFPKKEEVEKYIFARNHYRTEAISNTIIHTTNNNTTTDDTDDTDDLTKLTIREGVSINEWDIALYNDIIFYLQERAELPDEKLYDLITLWVFHTYAMERADFSPIIYFLGLPEKGKSRMLKAMTYIARRGLRKISLTDAQILRDCTHLDATLAMDMMNLWNKIEKAGSEDVFLNRPERGIDVSRVNRPDKGAFADTDYYTVFGPTIFATNELIDEILDTRAIPIVMKKSKKEFCKKVQPNDALDLKNRLTAWRACTMGDEWSEVGRIAGSRLGDITQPLYQIVKNINPEREQTLIDIVKDIEIKRVKEKADTLSGQIISAALKCVTEVTHGYLKSQIITNKFNEDKLEKEKISSRKILNKLKTMGFETTVAGDGAAAIFWNVDLIVSLKEEFGVQTGTE